MSRILLGLTTVLMRNGMGELILREEGYEVVTITDGATVLVRLRDVDPDLILVDVEMPTKSGYEICEFVKNSLRHLHTRVVLVAGAADPVDEQEAQRVHADGILKKPFEASVVLETVKPLLAAAASACGKTELVAGGDLRAIRCSRSGAQWSTAGQRYAQSRGCLPRTDPGGCYNRIGRISARPYRRDHPQGDACSRQQAQLKTCLTTVLT